jgi:hypothetical protein
MGTWRNEIRCGNGNPRHCNRIPQYCNTVPHYCNAIPHPLQRNTSGNKSQQLPFLYHPLQLVQLVDRLERGQLLHADLFQLLQRRGRLSAEEG